MKMTIREDSVNYACQVIKLPTKQKVEGLDNLVRVTVFGNDCLIGKDSPEEELYLFFPAECSISPLFLYENNLYRHSDYNKDKTKKGFFEDTGRVKSIKFKGIISTGFVIPVSSLDNVVSVSFSSAGEEFTDIDGINICKKYKIVRLQGNGDSKESRHNKKLKAFDKLIPNQFRFHNDTSHFAKNVHHFKPNDLIVITDKWHGTSAVFANVLIKKKLNLKEKVAKFFGVKVVDKVYDNLYSSRSVIKNQYINESVTLGYYNEDIWATANEELKDKIEQGVTLYGEIVGYLKSGKEIQKGYAYGCEELSHKTLIYRITYTKPDGSVIEYNWNQIKEYCNKYSLEYVKELFYGKAIELAHTSEENIFQEQLLKNLQDIYLEKDCEYCGNGIPAEGICVRIDGLQTYSTYKLKSRRFLERETKDLDAGIVSIEEEQTAVV